MKILFQTWLSFKSNRVVSYDHRIIHVSVAGVAPDAEIWEAEAEPVVVALLDAVEEHVLVDIPAAVDLEALRNWM